MTFEQRMAELGVDLDFGMALLPTHNIVDAIKACQEYYAEIIDRMETRLVNVTGERDYLRAKYSANPNETVPEDWRADDD